MSRPMRLAGLEPLNIDDDSLFVNVGERTNVTGSRAFAKLVLAGDFAGATSDAKQAQAVAPTDAQKQSIQALITRLDAKQDINK